jgi:hypothetical protein
MGHQTLSADEPAGRSSRHRLTFLLLAPMGASSKATATNNLPEFQGRSKVRKTLDTTWNPKLGGTSPRSTPNRFAPQFADHLLEIVAAYPEANTILSGDGQPEFTPPQGVGRPLRIKDRRPVMGSVYSALHTQTRQLAEPSRDRDQPVQP